MATKTIATLNDPRLTGIQIPPHYNATPETSDADFATIMNLIIDDIVTYTPLQLAAVKRIFAGAIYGKNACTLTIPGRGVLIARPGDWVGVDQQGWPILIGRASLPQTLTATGNTSSTSPTVSALSANVRALGWMVGMMITGTGVSSGSVIGSIAQDGLSLTLASSTTLLPVNGASPQTGTTLTVNGGGWTHS